MSLQNPQIYAIAGALESTMVRPDGTPMFEDQFNPALYKEIFGRDVKDKPITSLREQTTKIRDYVENVFNSDPDIKAVNDEMTTLLAQAESRGVYMADSVGNAKELPVMLGYDTKVDIPLSTSFSEWSKSPHVFGIAASEHDGATAARDVYNQFIAPFSSIGEDGKGYGSSGNFTPYAAMDGVNVMAAQYAAPGTEIDYNKQASYGIAMPFDGTSASAPRFAATLAQMLALNPKLTREQIDEAFAATSIDSPFHDDVEEGEMGIINREAAVMYVAENFMADAPPKLKLTPYCCPWFLLARKPGMLNEHCLVSTPHFSDESNQTQAIKKHPMTRMPDLSS
jgi:hypothetical protein